MTGAGDEFETKAQRRQASYEDYAREKLWQALGCLIAEGPLRKRITSADDFLVRLTPQHFPDVLIPKFLKVKEASERIRSEAAGSLNATAVSQDEVESTAEDILSLYVNLKGGITASVVK